MSEKTLLSPSLRVENGDYHEQAAVVMRSLIRFYDSMIKLGPFMKISQTKLDKLEDRAKLARDNLRKFLQLVPARNDKQELHILTYKKRLTEHCHLQHTLEVWKSALRNFSSLPNVPAEMLDFPPTYGPQPVTQMIDKILADCSLPVDLQHWREEMVELEVLKPFSTITRESCRLFFDSLSDKSAILRLENRNKTAAKKSSTSVRTEKKDSRANEPCDNSFMYIYPPGFTPSAATKAFLEQQVPAPKKTYVLPPYIFEKEKRVLPDIRGDLQKEMERLAAKKPTCHVKSATEARELDMVTAPVKRSTPRMVIDRYDEYLKIKKTLQGLIGPTDSTQARTALVDTTDKQKVEDPLPEASELSDIVRGSSTTLDSDTSRNDSGFHTMIDLSDAGDFLLPEVVQDKKHYAKDNRRSKSSVKTVSIVKNRKRKEIEASQEKAKAGGKVGFKHSDRAMKQRNEKRIRNKIVDGKCTDSKESASKRVKDIDISDRLCKLKYMTNCCGPDFSSSHYRYGLREMDFCHQLASCLLQHQAADRTIKSNDPAHLISWYLHEMDGDDAAPVQLSFLEPAFVEDYKIPKRRVKSVKCLGIPKVGLKRKGHDDVEADRCGKRSRNH